MTAGSTPSKAQRVLDEAIKLAKKYPDFKYKLPGREGLFGRCEYNSGGDENHPELCGCIVGQAARAAGLDTRYWDGLKRPGIRSVIYSELSEDSFSKEAGMLAQIQMSQDQGVPWGECITKAGMTKQ